ncbi:MAG: PCP reductase family protein [Cyanophyceae cyanobacterium]|jgi:hypothetical protein
MAENTGQPTSPNEESPSDPHPKIPAVTPTWADEAQAILKQVPFFARNQARRSIEQMAMAEGIELITPEVVRRAQAKFGQ